MTLFSRRLHRLDDPNLIEAAVRTLHKEGFERHDIEEALIRTAPVDLDILAQCLAQVLQGHDDQIGTGGVSVLPGQKLSGLSHYDAPNWPRRAA